MEYLFLILKKYEKEFKCKYHFFYYFLQNFNSIINFRNIKTQLKFNDSDLIVYFQAIKTK